MVMRVLFFVSVLVIAVYQLRNEDNKPRWTEWINALVFFFIVSFVFSGISGCLESGYHLVDDHEIYEISYKFATKGLWPVMRDWVLMDLRRRYRFSYYVIRVIQSYLLRDNWYYWHIMYASLTAINMFLGYYYLRLRKCTVFVSFVFAYLLLFGGRQVEVTYRLGPQENISLLFLLITLVFMRKYYETERRKWLVLSCLSTFVLSGTKEAFFLLLPSLPILFLYWYYADLRRDVELNDIRIVLRKYGLYAGSTAAYFIVGCYIIVAISGIGGMGYAGIDNSFGLQDYISSFKRIITGDLKVYLLGLVCVVIFLFIYFVVDRLFLHRMDKKRILLFCIALAVLIGNLILQLILHAKSGMMWRYLLPSTFCITLFWFLGMSNTCYSKKMRYVLNAFVFVFGLVLLLSTDSQKFAEEYGMTGSGATILLEMLADIYRDGDIVLVDQGGPEKDVSSEIYLEIKHGITDVYDVNMSHDVEKDGKYYDNFHAYDTKNNRSIDIDEVDIYFTNKSGDSLAIKDCVDDYIMYRYGYDSLYVRREKVSNATIR